MDLAAIQALAAPRASTPDHDRPRILALVYIWTVIGLSVLATTASLAAGAYCVYTSVVNLDPLAVHFMLSNIIHSNRLKCTCTHMKCHKRGLHTPHLQAR